MTTRILLFTQPGCLSCELMKVFLEAKEIAFEEIDITVDADARHAMAAHGSGETPTLVIFSGETRSGVKGETQGEVKQEVREVIVGFDPERLDQLLDPAPSSDSVTES